MHIRQGAARDRTFIRELSARVFARFGDYETTLPVMAGRPEVYTLIVEADRQRIGFAMYTIETPAAADLLAIAVLPEWQLHGAGKLLLDGVEAAVRDCAGEAGETSVRLHLVAVWREAKVFTEAERAALELTEQGTRIADAAGGVTDEAWATAAKHYDTDQLAALVCTIAMINTWNRLNVICGNKGGDYQPGQWG